MSFQQSDKDSLVAAANAVATSVSGLVSTISSIAIDPPVTTPPVDVSAMQAEIDQLKITNASLQSKIDMAKTALS
jgi:hypothetical protein